MPLSTPTRLLVFPPLVGERLDRFLAAATALSRRKAREAISAGEVLRNGRPIRVQSRELELADVIDVLRPPAELEVPPRPELPEIPLLHRDPWLLVVDKPAGMLSQPAERRGEGELACDEAVRLQLAAAEGRPPFLRLIHRLDRLTSGVLLFATDRRALEPLSRLWREKRVHRRYRALVHGVPALDGETGRLVIEAPLAKVPGGGWKFEVAAGGKASRTDVEVVAAGDERSLVECRLLTGRTHQVRVHLAHSGHPVVGDRLYGGGEARRLMLHALELSLPHPKTGETLTVTAPPPPELEAL
ncbi:MAG: RluA family pseudouridine synthase [Acidobacteriota bacterium]|nr:RluA family pseudouridine synthase [Acidobacteriota bacterium]